MIDTKRHAPNRALFTAVALFAVLATVPRVAFADYPDRPIKVIVPYQPGGATDLIARLVAQKVSDDLRQPVVVENRPGAGGMIGESTVAKAPADGYTVLVDATGVALNPSLYRKPAYDPAELQPVAQLMTSPFVVVINPAVPIHGIGEIAGYAKTNAAKFNVATAGNSTLLAAQLFRLLVDTEFTFVPYNGAAPAALSVVTGDTQLMFSDLTSFGQNISSGKLRALAVAGEKRLAALPEVPTAREAGVAGFVVTSWFAAFVPAGTPPEVVQRLNTSMNRAVMQPDVAARLATLGAEPVALSVDGFAKFYRDELARWKDVIKRANVPLIE
jgi:tripartite-type tricarboxylate transporter receptor subunit TctC